MISPGLPRALAAGIAHSEARMTETIKVGPLVETENEAFELVKSVQADQTGPALVKYPTLTVSDRQIPGQQVAVADVIVKRPIGSAISPVGHWFEVTASSVDPSLVGRRFVIKAPPQSGQVTSHRYPVVEQS